MAGGDQPTINPPPPPTEEVVKQPSPTGEVVKITHATNASTNVQASSHTAMSEGNDSGLLSPPVPRQPAPPGEVEKKDNTTKNKPTYSNILKAAIHAASDFTEPAGNAEQLSASEEQQQTSMELKPTKVHDGKTSVRFKLSDKARYLNSMKHVLVGKFSHGRPPIGLLKEFFVSLKLKGEYNISLYDTKHLFIECALIEDFTRLWMRNNWYVKGFPMRMFKWTDDFNPNKESPLSPVWVHFDGLPLYLFNEEALFSIANTIGSPLRIDQLNINRVKLGSASVCVALDVSKPILDKIWVAFEEEDSEEVVEGFWQQVTYDHFPAYCSCCNHLGHVMTYCKRQEEKEAQLVYPISSAENAKEVESIPENKARPVFRRVPIKPRHQAKAKSMKRTTKEWVKTVFGETKKEDQGVEISNPFKSLEVLVSSEEVKEPKESQLEVLVPSKEVKEPVESRRPYARSHNILDASSLPPPSLLAGCLLQTITYKDALEDFVLPLQAKSTPASPTKQGEETTLFQSKDPTWEGNGEMLEGKQDINGKEGVIPSHG
ncbi:hypothetical protein LIER_42856 [Lithospermum erythrorhizon]|uniref:DUF4283 domain-containing protein n=1 Tax=Lithospermum erythrorhizon TaxID=34254 RepID=A0AAV3P547_LITER